MISQLWKVVFFSLCLPFISFANDGRNVEGELKQLAGSWKVKRLEVSGVASPANQCDKIRIVVEGNYLIVKGVDGSQVKNYIHLNPKTSPQEIDLEPLRNQAPTARGIYQLNGSTMILCVSDEHSLGKSTWVDTRPKSFSSTPRSSGQVLMELEKVKE
jgi:uncharacterized protein (TIGR03067 family)